MNNNKTLISSHKNSPSLKKNILDWNGNKYVKHVILSLLSLFLAKEAVSQQSMASFLGSSNGITAGNMQTNIVQNSDDDGGIIRIPGNGQDGVSNVMIKIFDNNNVFIETLSYPSNISGDVLAGRKVEYYGDSGEGESCNEGEGGKDHVKFENGNGVVTYNNPDQCVKLPVATSIELEHFLARCVQEGQQVRFVEVTRSTLSETNNNGFRVQKSDDGKTRVNIAWIPGAGTSRDKKNYSFIDLEGTDGVDYYRLEDVSGDGLTGYSDIEVVQDCDSGEGNSAPVYPNPVNQSQWFTVGGVSETDNIVVSNIHGQQVPFQRNGDQLQLRGPGGTYIVKNVRTGVKKRVVVLGGSSH